MESYICLKGKKIKIEDYRASLVLIALEGEADDQGAIKEVFEELLVDNNIMSHGVLNVVREVQR